MYAGYLHQTELKSSLIKHQLAKQRPLQTPLDGWARYKPWLPILAEGLPEPMNLSKSLLRRLNALKMLMVKWDIVNRPEL